MYSNIIYRHITCWCEVPNPTGQHTVSTCTEHVLWVTGKTDVRRSTSFVMMCRNTQCTILWTQKTYFKVVTEQRDKNTSKLLGLRYFIRSSSLQNSLLKQIFPGVEKTLWGKEKREMHEDDKKMARKKNQDENLWGRGMVHKPYNLYHRH